MKASPRQLVIWRLLDGKPGHENQSLGLQRAMGEVSQQLGGSAPLCIDVSLKGVAVTPLDWLRKRFLPGRDLPRPDFILAAGHATHLPLLCARRAHGGRSIVLMKPSMPCSWFDIVVAPAHDEVSGCNVLVTHGALNTLRPATKRPGSAIVLIGGDSRHFRWDDTRVLVQVEAIMSRYPQALITDSRRTPAALRQVLASRFSASYQPWEACAPGWLAQTLAETEVSWVSEDSVSMVYESLSAGCALGLIGLALPEKGAGRLVRGIQSLEKVVRFDDWYAGRASLSSAQPALQEATRVARLILDPGHDHSSQ